MNILNTNTLPCPKFHLEKQRELIYEKICLGMSQIADTKQAMWCINACLQIRLTFRVICRTLVIVECIHITKILILWQQLMKFHKFLQFISRNSTTRTKSIVQGRTWTPDGYSAIQGLPYIHTVQMSINMFLKHSHWILNTDCLNHFTTCTVILSYI